MTDGMLVGTPVGLAVGALDGALDGTAVSDAAAVDNSHAVLETVFTSAQQRTPAVVVTATQLTGVDNLVDPGATIWPPGQPSSAHTITLSSLHPVPLATSSCSSATRHNRAPAV
jgi:hypothetical protein